MKNSWILYLYIFLIVPMLFFIGFSILIKDQQFRLFPLFSVIILVLVVIIHTRDITEFTKSMFTGKKIHIQKAIGIFVIFLGTALLLLNSYLLYQQIHSKIL